MATPGIMMMIAVGVGGGSKSQYIMMTVAGAAMTIISLHNLNYNIAVFTKT